MIYIRLGDVRFEDGRCIPLILPLAGGEGETEEDWNDQVTEKGTVYLRGMLTWGEENESKKPQDEFDPDLQEQMRSRLQP